MKDQSITVRLPGQVLQWIERVSGGKDVSGYVAEMVVQQFERTRGEATARDSWLSEGRQQYTPEVCRRTLEVNEEFPVEVL